MSFKGYIAELQKNLKSGQATEPSYYPSLKALLESLESGITVLVNPKKTQHGSPDFSLKRKGKALDFPVGWIEAKEVGEDLNKVERSGQLKRYLHLPNVVLTDFLEFRWYTDGKLRHSAVLGTLHKRKLKLHAEGEAAVRELLVGFLQHKIPPTRDSRELARRMAGLAHLIRDAILAAYERERENSKLHKQLEAFRDALLPDLKPDQFADMYAQTIAYGLFAARCQPVQGREEFTRERAAYLIPKTNPFLRRLFNEIAGPELPEEIQPDVDDLVSLLRATDIGSVLSDFGKRTAKEDPVVHFYEDFLQAYDPALREMRGVYYTPEPVVSYIVRSIDHILKARFNKPMGLADKDVLILDPACGTGTFLYFVIRQIYDTLCQQGQKGQWSSYVSENLLKRIFGFELLMAPYAVAHLKLGLQLQELGYHFDSEERLGIYLTNTLEEAVKKAQQIFVFAEAIAEEANAASEVKQDRPIMVVLGNPPYSGHSANRSWKIEIDRKTQKPKKVPTFIGQLLQDYYRVDGKPLGEKNPKWLQDDYVKFIRFAQWRIDRTGYGVLGFITNHSYLDNPTFRGMRQQLSRDFTDIRLLDLHGNAKKKETAPDGSKDENVFDIQQGVAIGLYVKTPNAPGPASVHHADLWGTRESKYKFLYESNIQSTPWKNLAPTSMTYLFVPQKTDLLKEYERGWKVTDAMPLNVLGFQTHRDAVAVAFDGKSLKQKITEFLGKAIPEPEWERFCQRCAYRPFDWRVVYLHKSVSDRPRLEVMRHMFYRNVALNVVRQTKADDWRHAVVSDAPAPALFVEIKDGSTVFPLYCYSPGEKPREQQGRLMLRSGVHEKRAPNFAKEFISALESALGLHFAPQKTDSPRGSFAPEDVLNYIYAVFHSPSYRTRYADLLKSDFPRIPVTSDKVLFASLAAKGRELVSLHLLESPKLGKLITRYEKPGDHAVEKVGYAEPNPKAGIQLGRVYINATQYFEGVPKEIWEFQVGGYQVCDKWLKDRKGRKLSSDEIDHYQKITVALNETIRLMREIDALIPAWPLS